MDHADPFSLWITHTVWPLLEGLLGHNTGTLGADWCPHGTHAKEAHLRAIGPQRATITETDPIPPGLIAAPTSAHDKARIHSLKQPFFLGLDAQMRAFNAPMLLPYRYHIRFSITLNGHWITMDARAPHHSSHSLVFTTPTERRATRDYLATRTPV